MKSLDLSFLIWFSPAKKCSQLSIRVTHKLNIRQFDCEKPKIFLDYGFINYKLPDLLYRFMAKIQISLSQYISEAIIK